MCEMQTGPVSHFNRSTNAFLVNYWTHGEDQRTPKIAIHCRGAKYCVFMTKAPAQRFNPTLPAGTCF
jgi:hypothetical protein